MYKRTILLCIAFVNFQSIEASNRPNINPCPSLSDGFALSGLYDIPSIPTIRPQKFKPIKLYLDKKNDDTSLLIDANNFPALQEGFELCGHDLQQFFNQKLLSLTRPISQEPECIKKKSPQEELNDEDILEADTVMDLMHALSQEAELFLQKTFIKNKTFYSQFYSTLTYILENDLDINQTLHFLQIQEFHNPYCLSTRQYNNNNNNNHAPHLIFEYCRNFDFMQNVVKNYIVKDRLSHHSLFNKILMHDNISALKFFIRTTSRQENQRLLGLSIKAGSYKITQFLVDTQTEIAINEKLLLHNAATWGHCAIVELLIERGADIHKRDRDGNTPLHHAVRWDNKKIASLLLRTGANVNEQNNEGRTPLHLACIDRTIIGRNHHIILPMLIHAGADVHIRDNDNHLPHDGSSFNLCFVFHQAMARKYNQQNSAIFNMACYVLCKKIPDDEIDADEAESSLEANNNHED